MSQSDTGYYQCMVCGKRTDICYSDNGLLGMARGDIRCRDCYAVARTAMSKLLAEVADLRTLVEDAIDFDHAAGCSGALGEQHLCKCGRREWLARAQWALGE